MYLPCNTFLLYKFITEDVKADCSKGTWWEMNGNESVETFSVSLFPVDSLYCFFFNPFLNSCDVYSGLCLYLFVCYLYSCFFQKAPLGSSDKSERILSFWAFRVPQYNLKVKLLKEPKRKVRKSNE